MAARQTRFIKVLALASLTLGLFGQDAAVTGTVIDPAGGVISNVRIELLADQTGSAQTTATNQDGIFTLPFVRPGIYTVRASAPGFKQFEKKPVTVETAQSLALEVRMDLGETSEIVTVDGRGIPVNTVDASVSAVVDRQFVENIPLNGRSFQSLLSLVPGATTVVSSRGSGQSGSISVNGQRTESNYFMVDGVSANTGAYPSTPGWGAGYGGSTPGETVLGTTQSLVSVDALEEFRATTSTYSAEYGRAPGGQFSFTTRSGTNNWHGSLFNYFRNDALDANNWFSNSTGTRKPAQRQNDFGGTLGGPLSIPKIYNGKDRTFFFFSYEGLRLRTPLPAVVSDVPSLSLRANAPAELKMFLNAFPLPNGPDPGTGLAQYTSVWSSPGSLDSTSARVDHNLSNAWKVFARYSDSPSNSQARAATNMARVTSQEGSARTLTLGLTGLLSSRINNDLRFNFTRNAQGQIHTLDTFGGAIPFEPSQVPGFPNSRLGHIDIYLQWGLRPNYFLNTKNNVQRQINLTDSLNVFLGRHNLKFGIDYRRLATTQRSPELYQFAIYNSLTEVVTNRPANLTLERFTGGVNPIYTNFSAYAQDTWKASQRLNVTLGLRWDVNPAPTDADGNVPFNLDQLSNLSTAKVTPAGAELFRTRWANIAPRIGVAYQLRQRQGFETVLRMGAGLFYDTVNSTTSMGYFGVGRVGALRYTGGTAAFPANEPAFAALPPSDVNPPYNFTVYAIDRNMKSPYTWQWSAAIEQALGAAQTLTVSYVGAGARQLPVRWTVTNTAMAQINRDFSAWGVNYAVNGANSSYNALQVKFQRRLARGLQATVTYAWSHTLDDATNNFSVNKLIRGNSDYDIRHNFQSAITYDVRARLSNAALTSILNNWSFDTRISAQSAPPVDVIGLSGVDPSLGITVSYQPNVVFGQPLYLYDPSLPGGRRFNFNAFANAPAGVQGNLGRNVMRGFSAAQADIAIRREFRFGESLGLQFRVEAFNAFNNPNFGNIYNQLSQGVARFGIAYSTQNARLGGLNSLYQIGGPRSIQLALRLKF